MKLTQEQVDAMTLPERGLWLQCESMELEITSLRAEYKSLLALAKLGRHDLCEAAVELRRLQAENESLCALAKFGDLVIGLISQGGTLDRDMVIDGMLKTGVAEVDQEGCLGFSSLAQLPEERE